MMLARLRGRGLRLSWPRLVLLFVAVCPPLLLGVTVFVLATSVPPKVPSLPVQVNRQIALRIAEGRDYAAGETGVAYETAARQTGGIGCSPDGRWLLDVNPQDVIGRPYALSPTIADWARAAHVIHDDVDGLCAAPVVLTWVGHDPAHPTSDRWQALVSIDPSHPLAGSELQHDAMRSRVQL